MQITDMVLLPKISPLPPVAITTASARKERICMVRMSWATMPTHLPVVRAPGQRNSQNSYLVTLPFGFPPAGLFVEGVEQLLAGGGAGEKVRLKREPPKRRRARWPSGVRLKGTPMRSSRSMISRGPVGHFQHGRLIGEEIAAEHGFVEMHPLAVSLLAGDVVAGVDAALGADAVAALDGDHGEQIDGDAFLGELHAADRPANPAADHDDSLLGHEKDSSEGTQAGLKDGSPRRSRRAGHGWGERGLGFVRKRMSIVVPAADVALGGRSDGEGGPGRGADDKQGHAKHDAQVAPAALGIGGDGEAPGDGAQSKDRWRSGRPPTRRPGDRRP